MQCLGGNGYINGKFDQIAASWLDCMELNSVLVDYPVARIVRDSRLYAVGAGTQEIRRMLIGREFNEQFKNRSS